MRSFLRDHWKVVVAIIVLALLAMFFVSPGAAAPAPTLAARLRTHVAALTPGEDGGARRQHLAEAARYIATTLRGEGYAVRRQPSAAEGQALPDLEVALANLAPHARPERIFIIGAHVGAPTGHVGLDPNDERSGTAAALELARLLKDVRPSRGTEIRLVFFFNDALPCPPDQTAGPMSGRDFIAFVGTAAASRQAQQELAAFQGSEGIPARGLATPAYVQGVTLSGQAAAGRLGGPAIMVTDTAFGRYPYFEATNEPDTDTPEQADQPDQPDYAGIARVVDGLARTIEALACEQQS